MWGESSNMCESNCQCSGLITESFKINSGNNATKRRHEEAVSQNFKFKMIPHPLNFEKPLSPKLSPLHTPRRVLGDIQNSPLATALKQSPLIDHSFSSLDIQNSPVTTKRRNLSKISRVFEERNKFKMSSNKENEFLSHREDSFMKLVCDENTMDSSFNEMSPLRVKRNSAINNWTTAKLSITPTLNTPTKMEECSRDSGYSNSATKPLYLEEETIDFSDLIATTSFTNETELNDETNNELCVPQTEGIDTDNDFETLHDMDQELESQNFDDCTKYEIISTDSPNIISRGHSSRKIQSKNFVFGAPIADTETSTSFNKPNPNATRMLKFDEFGLKNDLESPRRKLSKELSSSSFGSSSSSPVSIKTNLNSGLFSANSIESGFISEIEEASLEIEESSNSPKIPNFTNLLSGQIKTEIRQPLQRSISQPENRSKAKTSLFSTIFESPGDKRGFKCLEEEIEGDSKRRKANCDIPKDLPKRPVLQRAFSENAASIMSAMARSASNPDLIGDFSLPFALPLICGQHTDLKSISCDTLAELMKGGFKDSVNEFQVIDCRYPYEYSGGHISGSLNLYTPEQILSLMSKPRPDHNTRRNVLVFHCEFSLQRGPTLSRFLRSSDRAQNVSDYPFLHYPEVYLLHEGYKSFYQNYPELCEPTGYTAMLDPKHKKDLQLFRNKSEGVTLKKSYSMDERRQKNKIRSRLLW